MENSRCSNSYAGNIMFLIFFDICHISKAWDTHKHLLHLDAHVHKHDMYGTQLANRLRIYNYKIVLLMAATM